MASSGGSGGRSPQKLRELVNSSKFDSVEFPEEMKANLEKLRALSKDDLSENGLLRSRIDQQCELICILKQRADESLKKCMTLEEENSELKKHRDEILTALHNETRKFAVMEKRFFVLNKNHEELIKIKDEYKTENEKLRMENTNLRRENEGLFGSLVQERDAQIKQLRDELKSLHDEYQAAREKERIALGNLSAMEKKNGEQTEKLQQEIKVLQKEAEEQHRKSEEKLKMSSIEKDETQAKVLGLAKDRDEFAKLALERGKALEEKQREMKEICQKLEETERSLKETEDKFVSELRSMSVNAQVVRLKKQLEDSERRQRESAKEHDAYKRHMSTLLGKEKELNNKLRVLIG